MPPAKTRAMPGATRTFRELLLGAAIFIVVSGRAMPAMVASHFGADGGANRWMSSGQYLIFMLAFGVALPGLIVYGLGLALQHASGLINLPNRDYWLEPERRAETVQYLEAHFAMFGSLLAIFVCFVHGLVVVANAALPPRLPTLPMIACLVAFLLATLIWIGRLYRRFRLT